MDEENEDLDVLEQEAPEAETEIEDEGPEEEQSESRKRLEEFASKRGDISELLSADELSKLGAKVVADYERDDESRSEWKNKVKEALSDAAQDEPGQKSFPFENASNVKYPMLTVAAQQFAARAYPAIVKGDEAVKVKVFGEEPAPPPQRAIEMAQKGDPDAQRLIKGYQVLKERQEAKRRRANRVKDYLNYQIFYGMDGWEADTDAMLNVIPITGMAFRKIYYDMSQRKPCVEMVSALNLVVPCDTRDLKRCPRITQEFELYPYEISQRQQTDVYRDVVLPTEGDDDQAPRKLIEQHRLEDLDGDGVAEPYIITVDTVTSEVLRIDAVYTMDDVEFDEEGKVLTIERWVPYVDYPFLPDPKGRFYAIGFGHLLKPLLEVINTSINQLNDAGTAQIAGGGFLASGVRLQGAGQNSSLRWKPGEYKTVNVPGSVLKDALVERTFPSPSTVTFQMLDMMLAAAKDIASVKDVLTGETPSTAPVGTTLAVIEQGLQVFTSIYKRIYRSLKDEFRKLYECEARYGDREDYKEVLDDPEADMDKDFEAKGKDIMPVSDPSAVTKMQSMAKAQALLPLKDDPRVNGKEILRRYFVAVDDDNPDALLAPDPPPNPAMIADAKEKDASAQKSLAGARKDNAQAEQVEMENAGVAALLGGVPNLAGQPGNPMGAVGGPPGGGGPEGGMAPGVMGGGPVGPGPFEGIEGQG